MRDRPSLYRRLLGPAFDRLPPEIQAMHAGTTAWRSQGRCDIDRGGHPLARLVAGLFRLPPTGRGVPVSVTFTARGDREIWLRNFGGRFMRTTQEAGVEAGVEAGDEAGGGAAMIERFGPLAFRIGVKADTCGIELQMRALTFRGLPLPRFLAPKTVAGESVVDGRFAFDVAIALPLIGPLVHYRGQLDPPAPYLPHPTVLFDGVCNLCNGNVAWLIRRDRQAGLRFAAMQSEAGQRLLRREGLPLADYDSFALLDEGRVFLKSDAALRQLKYLPAPWPWLRIAWLLPRPLRDWLYDRIARNRYRLFGKRAACMMPSPDVRARFLE